MYRSPKQTDQITRLFFQCCLTFNKALNDRKSLKQFSISYKFFGFCNVSFGYLIIYFSLCENQKRIIFCNTKSWHLNSLSVSDCQKLSVTKRFVHYYQNLFRRIKLTEEKDILLAYFTKPDVFSQGGNKAH